MWALERTYANIFSLRKLIQKTILIYLIFESIENKDLLLFIRFTCTEKKTIRFIFPLFQYFFSCLKDTFFEFQKFSISNN
jgi:hypothetical protein